MVAGGTAMNRAVPEGEFFSISERLILASAWGRLHREAVNEGRRLEPGAAVGCLRGVGPDIPLVSPVGGIFELWLAVEGELVRPGQAVACVRTAGG